MSRSPIPCCNVLRIVALALCISAGSAAADSAAHFAGSYRYAGDESETRMLQQTLENLVGGFNPILRGLARHRLNHSMQVPERVEIVTGSGDVSLRVVGAPDFPSDARYENGVLVLRQSSFEGSRETWFRLSEDGMVLLMRVTTRSALLPNLLDYELTFVRDPEGLVGPPPRIESGS